MFVCGNYAVSTKDVRAVTREPGDTRFNPCRDTIVIKYADGGECKIRALDGKEVFNKLIKEIAKQGD